ncbi:hypothetical protein BDD12DRAFT_803226 [Trichophaea hybrida]|nr:hypothetical protein BDD12DRAFT_803226 [Trichophaea hybrida]
MVTQESATWAMLNEATYNQVPIDGNHSTMVKYTDRADRNYVVVVQRLKEYLKVISQAELKNVDLVENDEDKQKWNHIQQRGCECEKTVTLPYQYPVQDLGKVLFSDTDGLHPWALGHDLAGRSAADTFTFLELWYTGVGFLGNEEPIYSIQNDVKTVPVHVTAGRPRFDQNGRPEMNKNQTLASYFSRMFSSDLQVEMKDSLDHISNQFESIKVITKESEYLDISFRRTVRIPDDGRVHKLPPDLGCFPIFNVENFKALLPKEMAITEGLFFPMYLDQDYIIIPGQMWLDGIATEPGIVRQLVISTMCPDPAGNHNAGIPPMSLFDLPPTSTIGSTSPSGSSIEYQATGSDTVGGIQLQILPELDLNPMSFTTLPNMYSCASEFYSAFPCINIPINTRLDPMTTPTELGLKTGDVIRLQELVGLEAAQQRLFFYEKQLEHDQYTEYYGIKKGSVIHLILKLRGGGNNKSNLSYNGYAFSVVIMFNEAPVAQINHLVAQKLYTVADAILLPIEDEILEDDQLVKYGELYQKVIYVQVHNMFPSQLSLEAGGTINQSIKEDINSPRIWD